MFLFIYILLFQYLTLLYFNFNLSSIFHELSTIITPLNFVNLSTPTILFRLKLFLVVKYLQDYSSVTAIQVPH